MAAIETGFSRGTVRDAFEKASVNESCLTYDAFRMRVMRARKKNASTIELEALALCVSVEDVRSAMEKTISKKIVKIRQAKKQEA
jgi:hypothetical protein